MKYQPRDEQKEAIHFAIDKRKVALFLGLGQGKTSVSLYSFDTLKTLGQANKCIVVSTVRVIRSVWRQEAQKWDQLKHLTFSLIHGTKKEREKALQAEADIYLINYENIPWLMKQFPLDSGPPFDTWIFDESSKMKNPEAVRFKKLKSHMVRVDNVFLLSATPAPKQLYDLWSQFYLLDQGHTLGHTHYGFMNKYFDANRYTFEITIKKGAKDIIYKKIAPMTLRLADKSVRPKPIINDIKLTLPKEEAKALEELEKEAFIQIEDQEVEAFNAAALMMKCRQFVQGFLYSGEEKERQVLLTNRIKLDTLLDLIESADGQPMLVAYQFQAEVELIQDAVEKEFKFRPPHIGSGVKHSIADKLVEDWNKKEIPVLLVHPQSVGHGINLQAGGSLLVFFALPWSLEDYEQTIGRLDRTGQTERVVVNRILVDSSVDDAVATSLTEKASGQRELLDYLLKYRQNRQV